MGVIRAAHMSTPELYDYRNLKLYTELGSQMDTAFEPSWKPRICGTRDQIANHT